MFPVFGSLLQFGFSSGKEHKYELIEGRHVVNLFQLNLLQPSQLPMLLMLACKFYLICCSQEGVGVCDVAHLRLRQQRQQHHPAPPNTVRTIYF
jgi:hypothetical protein